MIDDSYFRRLEQAVDHSAKTIDSVVAEGQERLAQIDEMLARASKSVASLKEIRAKAEVLVQGMIQSRTDISDAIDAIRCLQRETVMAKKRLAARDHSTN